MKPIRLFLLFFFICSLLIVSCATTPKGPDELNVAIRETSDYLNGNIPRGNKIVILNIQSDYAALSEYIIDELIANTVNDRFFSVVDRAQLEAIRMELNFQLSGEVDDDSALSIGKFLGAQTIVSGAMSEMGNRHRMTIRALNVQTAEVQGQFNRNINASQTITELMKGGRTSAASYGLANRTGGSTTTTSSESTVQAPSGGQGTAGGTTPTQPAAIANGTYTFFPRPRAMRGGVDEDVYLDRIVVRGGFFIIYLTDTARGGGNWLMWGNRWNHNGPHYVKLLDLDRPSRGYTAVRGGTNDTSTERFFSFQNISGKRFQLVHEYDAAPFSTFEEINLDNAEYEP